MTHHLALKSAHTALLVHPLLGRLRSAHAWRVFMAHHVFAVWDFMSLAKRLQQELTCTQLPWLPPKEPAHARFINEIVLAEESDEDGNGSFCSHFSFYKRAMAAAGAETTGIDQFIAALTAKVAPTQALQRFAPSPAVADFVAFTLDVAQNAPAHVVASVFFYGREDVIPAMFTALGEHVLSRDASFQLLHRYLSRHIDLDGDSHGPLAAQMLQSLCAGNAVFEAQAQQAALAALEHRCALWTDIADAIGAEPLAADHQSVLCARVRANRVNTSRHGKL